MRYVWLVEGEPYAGTLQQYANDLEMAQHGDLDVSATVWVWHGDGTWYEATPVVLDQSVWDDVKTYVVNVGVDEARYKVDLLS